MILYKNPNINNLLKLVLTRPSGINTFVEVDQKGEPIEKKRSWSVRPEQQKRLVDGFSNLEEIHYNETNTELTLF